MVTHDEAVKIAEVIIQVDGGCPHCITELVDCMKVKFPDFDWETLTEQADERWWKEAEEWKEFEA